MAAAIARRPGTALVANLIVLGAAGLLAAGAPERIAVAGGLADQDARQLLVVARGEPSVRTSANRAAVEVIGSGISADPAVAAVEPAPERGTRRRAVLEVRLRPRSPLAIQGAAERIKRRIDPGPLTVSVEGEAIEVMVARERLVDEAGRLGLLVLPFALLVLTLAFGARHAVAPLLAGLSGAAGGLAGLRLLAGPLDLAGGAALGVAVAVGLALGVEATAFLRRQADAMAGPPTAPADPRTGTNVDPATLSVVKLTFIAATAAALASLTALVIDLPLARAVAVGGSISALAGIASAVVATPAVLALFPMHRGSRANGWERRGGRLTRLLGRLPGWSATRRLRALLVGASIVGSLLIVAAPLLDPPLPLKRTPLLIVIALLTLAAVIPTLLAMRSLRLALIRGAAAALPAAAAAGLLITLGDGRVPLTSGDAGNTDIAAVVAVLVAVGTVSVARSTFGDLGTALAGTLVAGATLGVLAGSELEGARLLGAGFAGGVVADLVLVRYGLLMAFARGLPRRRASGTIPSIARDRGQR